MLESESSMSSLLDLYRPYQARVRLTIQQSFCSVSHLSNTVNGVVKGETRCTAERNDENTSVVLHSGEDGDRPAAYAHAHHLSIHRKSSLMSFLLPSRLWLEPTLLKVIFLLAISFHGLELHFDIVIMQYRIDASG